MSLKRSEKLIDPPLAQVSSVIITDATTVDLKTLIFNVIVFINHWKNLLILSSVFRGERIND